MVKNREGLIPLGLKERFPKPPFIPPGKKLKLRKENIKEAKMCHVSGEKKKAGSLEKLRWKFPPNGKVWGFSPQKGKPR